MKNKKQAKETYNIPHPRENSGFTGHENIVADIASSLRKNNMPGAFLLSGPKGIGKATLAYRLARFVFYSARLPEINKNDYTKLNIPDGSPVFAKVAGNSHPDLLVIEADTEKSKSGSILIEQAQKIQPFLRLTSADTAYRVVIIDSVDDMNPNAANSILKLLEEPPARALFILISHNPGMLLPTIKSRCRKLKMKPLPYEQAMRIFMAICPDMPENDASLLLGLAGGSPGLALNLHANGGLELYSQIVNILDKLPSTDILAINKLADSMADNAKWESLNALLCRILVDVTAYISSVREPEPAGARFAAGLPPALLVDKWEQVSNILNETTALNLDKRAALVNIFSILGERRA